MSNRIYSLPLFPLEKVLYPREALPLHIFEERYKSMIRRCLDQEKHFGVLLSENESMAGVGCTARVQDVLERYQDGRLDIMTEGEERFRIRQVDESAAAYLTAEVETIKEPAVSVPSALRERVITQHMKLMELAGHTVRPSIYEDRDGLSYTLARNAGLSLGQKQEVLELIAEDERFHYLAEYFAELLPRVEQQDSMRRRIQSNGHFEDFLSEQ